MKLELKAMGPDLRDPDTPCDLDVLAYCLEMVSKFSTAVEFGVGMGTSTEFIGQFCRVIGFDSFEGLPTDWRPDFGKGHFAQQNVPTIPNAELVVGQFVDTVPKYEWPEDVALIHFDADLYHSTRLALHHTDQLIKPGVILVFDEFHGFDDDFDKGSFETGEQRAFFEYAARVGLHFEVIGWGREQMAFYVVGRELEVPQGGTSGFLVGPFGSFVKKETGVISLKDIYDASQLNDNYVAIFKEDL